VEGKEKALLEGTDKMPELSEEDIKVSDMFYFELFHLNPIKASITFLPIQTVDSLDQCVPISRPLSHTLTD